VKLLLESLLVDLVYLLASPVVFLVLLVLSRGFKLPKYRRGFLQKLGYVPIREGDDPSLWIHAVSVGEALTAEPLVEALAESFPRHDISISVSTSTGFEVARQRYPGRTVFYAPFDVSSCATRALHRRRPDAILLVELELWPNFLLTAQRLGVPVLVVNGRLTTRSSRRYALAGGLARWLFGLVTAYAVQNEEYAARFRRLGVPPERVAVLGNLKHSRRPRVSPQEAEALRSRLGWPASDGFVVLVAGSTHPGEERLLCEVYAALREQEPRLRLVIAPRHVERLARGESASWGAVRPLVRWSEWRYRGDEALGERILLVDTVGELERFYALADMVVVGGSFVPHGGHNVFEPAALGKPTCFGPHTQNFADEVRVLLEAGAAQRGANGGELRRCLERWLADPGERRRLGEMARTAVEELQGAARRHVEWLGRALSLSRPETS
jgi:3-deoxy-D-manno-octulosonic-acid transferase